MIQQLMIKNIELYRLLLSYNINEALNVINIIDLKVQSYYQNTAGNVFYVVFSMYVNG